MKVTIYGRKPVEKMNSGVGVGKTRRRPAERRRSPSRRKSLMKSRSQIIPRSVRVCAATRIGGISLTGRRGETRRSPSDRTSRGEFRTMWASIRGDKRKFKGRKTATERARDTGELRRNPLPAAWKPLVACSKVQSSSRDQARRKTPNYGER